MIPFIHFYPHGYAHGQSLRHFLDKITKWHFHSIKSFGPKQFQISAHSEKVPFWQFFRMGWDGRALIGPIESLAGIEKMFLSWMLMNI